MTSPAEFDYDVFLSYDPYDRRRVLRIAKRLRTTGLRVWFDAWETRPGDDAASAMEQGLERSRTLVLCVSAAALSSNWVSMERSTVRFRDPSSPGRRFVPVLLANCALPESLRRYSSVDLRRETDDAFRELVSACQPQPGKMASEPGSVPWEERERPGRTRLAVLQRTIRSSRSWVNALAVSPDGQLVACATDDAAVTVWDMSRGTLRAELRGHGRIVRSVAFLKDGRQVVTEGDDTTVRIWDLETETEVFAHKGHLQPVVAVGAAGVAGVCSVSWDETIQTWSTRTAEQVTAYTAGSRSDTFCGAIAADGHWAVTGEVKGQVRRWNLQIGDSALLGTHSGRVRSVAITPDARFAISGSDDSTIKLWDLADGRCVGTLEGHLAIVHSVAVSPDGALLASAGFTDDTVRLWDWRAGTCLQVLKLGEDSSPTAVAFNHDGTRLVVGSASAPLHIYRLRRSKAAAAPVAERRYVNAKVVLVGESGVGKSALAHRLIEDRFAPTSSTHGMKVWRLDLPLAAEADREREALLWDLAGQEDYRLIHQLFLEETALALLLFNPQADDPFADVLTWLKVLRKAVARDVEKLLVASRVDVGNVKVSQRKIDRFVAEQGVRGYIATSALRGDGCSDAQSGGEASALKELIARHINWDALPWTSTPRLLILLKDAVLALTEQKNVRMLRFSEMVQRLEHVLPHEQFDDSDVNTAVTLLANQGLVLRLKFGNLVLLRPEVLNGYAAAVIRAARDHTDEIGCVKEQAVFDRTIDLHGVDRLDPADEELLMRAIVQTFLDKALCIAEDTPEGRQLVFPSQYRRERPIPQHPEIFVSYSFSGEWQTVCATLVVRLWYSREFKQKELWSNAAEFQTSKGHVAGLLMESAGEGEASISVFFDTQVPDELKVTFIEYVHRHLEKYAYAVRRDRRYVCPHCSRRVTDLDTVRERLADGKDFIYCQKCDRKVPLIDHIEQRLASDPIARKVLGMDETATRELDTQALEQILTGHMMAICGEANQIFRELTKFDYGIDGEVEFKSNDGTASGRKIYVQLKSGASYLRTRKSDGKEVFDVKNPRHLEYWATQPVDVYLVIRDAEGTIRWMNVTRYLDERQDKTSRQIIFEGEELDAPAVWRVRDRFFR